MARTERDGGFESVQRRFLHDHVVGDLFRRLELFVRDFDDAFLERV